MQDTNSSLEAPSLGKTAQMLPRVCASIVLALAGHYVFIWLFRADLKGYAAVSMKPNTALSLCLLAIALLLLPSVSESSLLKNRLAKGVAAVATLIGGLTFFQYIFDLDFHIDQLWANDFLNEESKRFPGRMAPTAAISLFCTGLSILLIDAKERTFQNFISACALVVSTILSLFAIIGYLYGEKVFYQFGDYIRISSQTAFCLFLLALGILYVKTSGGPIPTLKSTGLGGVLARRLLPVSILLPTFLGWSVLEGEYHSLYGGGRGTALLVVSLIVILASVVLFSSKRLDDLYSARETSRRNLAKALKARDEFFSIASHELNTPLASLKLYLQMHKKKSALQGPMSVEQTNKTIDMALKQVDLLRDLVDDFLDISRIRTGNFSIDIEAMNLNDLIQEVTTRISPQVAAAGATIKSEINGIIVGNWDQSRIDQVLVNFISNALKYAPRSPIHIFASVENERAVLVVQDFGPGMDSNKQKRIFGRFERGDTSIAGLGLGLFIVKRIVDAHNGEVRVDSEVNVGTKFTVTLPLDPFPKKTKNHSATV